MGLDILLLRKEPDFVRESEKKRDPNGKKERGERVDDVIRLDEEWKKTRGALDEAQKQRRLCSKEVGALMKAGKKEEAEGKKKEAAEAAELVNSLSKDEKEVEIKRFEALNKLGNIVHASVPIDDNEDNNQIVKEWGEFNPVKEGEFKHHELLEMIGGYNRKGVDVMGHRGYYLTGPGLMISLACLNYGLSFLMKKSYTPIQPPFMMDKEIMGKVAQLSQFDEELYHVSGDGDRYLIATSEQPLCALHMGEWIDEKRLKEPMRYAGLSTCFRKEAGAAGKDNRGIFRVHQFDKVEQFCITKPEDSWAELDRMVDTAAEFFQTLGIPYRCVTIVSGALNDAASKKIDLEGWFPAQDSDEPGKKGKFRELVSCSNCTDYQARMMGIRCGQGKAAGEKEKKFVHMLNGTLCANTRVLCALLENHQTEGGVQLPECLIPFLPVFVEGRPGFVPFVNDPPVEKEAKGKGGAKGKGKGKDKEKA